MTFSALQVFLLLGSGGGGGGLGGSIGVTVAVAGSREHVPDIFDVTLQDLRRICVVLTEPPPHEERGRGVSEHLVTHRKLRSVGKNDIQTSKRRWGG